MIFGKRIPTSFGNQVIERNPAKECRAFLQDKDGKHICQLYWWVENKVHDSIDIASGKSARLLLFIRSEKEPKIFYAYQPMSQQDLSPKTTKVPCFNGNNEFVIKVTYSYNKSITIPVGIEIDYNENFYVSTENSSSLF